LEALEIRISEIDFQSFRAEAAIFPFLVEFMATVVDADTRIVFLRKVPQALACMGAALCVGKSFSVLFSNQ
jgi:hypothetical protein